MNDYITTLLSQEDTSICPTCLHNTGSINGKDCRNAVIWSKDHNNPTRENCILVCCSEAGKRVLDSYFIVGKYFLRGNDYVESLKQLYRQQESNFLIRLFFVCDEIKADDNLVGKMSIENACENWTKL